MATTNAPDPGSLRTWEEAFQYPLPTVRKLSTRLRRNIDDHRSRLRSLVGTSYRDLLGTAERIIEMDRQIQGVEAGLGDIGRRCNSSILERADTNYTVLEKTWARQGGQDTKLQSLALSKVLIGAFSVVNRLIRTNDEALHAAKLMVLTRLLYKSLSETDHASVMLERHRRTITTLRNKLLAYIDREIGQDSILTDKLCSTLAAYALISSSSPKDVLKHFLAVRTANLQSLTTNSQAEALLKALNLYSSTFTSVQAVFPKRLGETLLGLSKLTLLSDKHISSVEELSLDIYGRWIPENIRSFTPWVQKDNLTAQEGKESMLDFSSSARDTLLSGLSQCLSVVTSIDTILAVRKQVLGAMLSLGTRIKLNDFMPQLEELREAFAARLDQLVIDQITIKDFLVENVVRGTSQMSMWDLAQEELDLSSGGMKLRTAILRTRNGRDASLDAVLAPYEGWRNSVERCWTDVKAIRTNRWDEYVEQDFDDGEDEDVTIYHDMLSVADAARMQKTLYAQVKSASELIFEKVHMAATQNTLPSPFLIRALRELEAQHVALSHSIELPNASSLIRHDVAKTLHLQLADSIADTGIDDLSAAYTSRHFMPLELWEGDPKLPSQPLPATFKYVLGVQRSMVSMGDDVWSNAAVVTLKQAVGKRLANVLSSEIVVTLPEDTAERTEDTAGEHTNGHVNGVEPAENESATLTADATSHEDGSEKTPAPVKEDATVVGDTRRDSTLPDASAVDTSQDYIQRLFDVMFISRVLETADVIEEVQAQIDIVQQRSTLETKDVQRLHKQANDYWKKTYVLFGFLAHPGTSYSK